MGQIYCKLFAEKEVKILFLGLDASGKTSLLYFMKLGEVVTTIPTIGFNVETLDYKNSKFLAWDIGGRDKIRPLLRHYYPNTDAVVFMVDSADKERLPDAAHEFERYITEEELRDVVVMVMANKQDLEGAASIHEISEKLKFLDLTRGKVAAIFPISVVTGDGIWEALDWLKYQLGAKAAGKYVTQKVGTKSQSVTKASSCLGSLVKQTMTSVLSLFGR